MEVIEGKGARPCECRLAKLRDKRLAAVPAEFQHVDLMRLKADPSVHPNQAKAIQTAQADPHSSFILCGRFGTGKTMLMWAIYKHLVQMNQTRIVACTLSELLNEYRTFIQISTQGGEPPWPRLRADELRQNETRFTIFLDDIDKAKPTEYAAEQFFEICDAIYAYKHQVVASTNLNIPKLIDHFNRADERFGGAIVRRLCDGAQIVEMF